MEHAHSSTPGHAVKPDKIRVQAIGTLDGWHYKISSTIRQTLASDFGPLPSTDFRFSKATAQLYSEAMAARCIQSEFPDSRIVSVCLAHRRRSSEVGK
jgi:hypothetical protein